VPLWIGLSSLLLLVAYALSFPGSLGFSRSSEVVGIKAQDGYSVVAAMPKGLGKERKRGLLFRDGPVLFEDGIALSRPDVQVKAITNAGRGRYVIKGSTITFSTSDAGDVMGRTYTVRSPLWSAPEWLLLGVWTLAGFASAIALRLAGAAPALLDAPRPRVAGLVLTAAFLAAFAMFPACLSDRFFLGLSVSFLWATWLSVLAAQTGWLSRIGMSVWALLPAFAGLVYFGWNAASDSSFVVAGIIPMSDAKIHFIQAAEISIQGTTAQMFNGRFLYPAFYSVFLSLTGLNPLVANVLISCLVLLALASTCPMVFRRIGLVGTTIYSLLFWLYFRAHGCGLVMTENLGLLLGVIGFGFLLLSVDKKAVWPIFVAVAFLGLGSAARPGALLILPALVLYAGIRVWITASPPRRIRAAAGALLLGSCLVLAGFAANHVLMKTLARGNAKAFGNFAFTLHGLLNDTKWSTSAEQFDWDTSRVMESNIRQIRESPARLIAGIGRAYAETWKKAFLFRFGEEKRLASAGLVLFLLASVGAWLWGPLRNDSLWMCLLAAAIVASIPFAPPWDAEERPYAVSEPIQIFLAAAGVAMILAVLWNLAGRLVPGRPELARLDGGHSSAAGLIAIAALSVFLVLPAPLLFRAFGVRKTVPPPGPTFLSGSQLLVSSTGAEGSISREKYLDRLSDFQAAYPAEAKPFASPHEEFVLAINWNNLETEIIKAVQER